MLKLKLSNEELGQWMSITQMKYDNLIGNINSKRVAQEMMGK